MDFMNNQQFSQLVISESAFTCMLNQFAKSKLGVLDLNEERINKLFGVDYIKLDTQSIYEHLPIFQNKLGQDAKATPLHVMITYSNINLVFG